LVVKVFIYTRISTSCHSLDRAPPPASPKRRCPGGAASIVGPAIGAVLFGVFTDVVSPSLPARLQPATPVILGVLLIVLMLTAPGGIVGIAQSLRTRVTARRLRSSGEGTAGAATAA
jgi:hypothetical protein